MEVIEVWGFGCCRGRDDVVRVQVGVKWCWARSVFVGVAVVCRVLSRGC